MVRIPAALCAAWIAVLLAQSSALAQSASDPFYDLNTYGLLTPVKNQGVLGTCWAFSDTTAFQSAVLKAGLAASPADPSLNLSPWHLATANGNITDLVPAPDPKTGELVYDGWGGFNDFAAGYWSRGRGQWTLIPAAATTPAGGGPVLTSANPLNNYPLAAAAARQDLAPFVAPASQPPAGFLLQTSIDFDWNGVVADLPAYQGRLKQALIDYGALSVYVKGDNPETDRDDEVFFQSNPDAKADHAVALIGWDDNYSVTIDGTNYTGAWIVQNSWGASGGADPVTGDPGYYFVPYADVSKANVKNGNAFVVRSRTYSPGLLFSPTVVQNQIFAPFVPAQSGSVLTSIGWTAGQTSLAVSENVIPSNSLLASFALYQTSVGGPIELNIYTGFGPGGPVGAPIFTQTGVTMNADGPGYNMVDFTAPIRIEEGLPLYFAVDFGTSRDFPVAVDTRTVSTLPPASGDYRGLSWVSTDGVTWTDTLDVSTGPAGAGLFFFKVFRLAENLNNPTINPLYDFTVDGNLLAGSSGPAPTILGLNFYDGGTLALQQNLTVTGGRFHVADSYATGAVTGPAGLLVPGNAEKAGPGTLAILTPWAVTGNMTVSGGLLQLGSATGIGGAFTQIGAASQTLLAPGTFVAVAGSGQVLGGLLATSGNLAFGGGLTLSNASLLVNPGGVLASPSLQASGSAVNLAGLAVIPGAVNLDAGSAFTQQAGTFAGGALSVSGSSTAQFQPGANASLASLLVNGGSVTVAGGARSSIAGALDVLAGALDIQAGGTQAAGGAASVLGALVVNGLLSSPSLLVGPGGLLSGAGTIIASVTNSGLLNPGNSPGTLNILGDFTQSATGTLIIETVGPELYDRLVVNGSAALAGTLQVVPLAGDALRFGDILDGFLQAGAISGTFDTVVLPEGYRGRVLADATELDLLVAPASYTQLARTGNQLQVARALDGYIPATGGDRREVSTALDRLRAEEYPAAFDAIAPTFHQSLPQITLEEAVALGQQMQNRWRAVQLGMGGFQTIGMEESAYRSAPAQPEGGPATVVTPADERWSAWVQGNGIFSDSWGGNNLSNYRSQGGGVMVGTDYRWQDAVATGLYAGYQGWQAEYDEGGSTTANGVRFGGYATLGRATGPFANALVGGGYTGYRTHRPIEFTGLNRTALAQPDGYDFEALVNTGWNWQAGNFNFGFSASGQYTWISVQQFTERGAQSLDLQVGRQQIDSLRGFLGGQAAYVWQATRKVAIVPQLMVYWQHEFLDASDTFSSALDGGAGPSFQFTSTAPQRDAVLATAGVSAQIDERWSANTYYTANFGRADFLSHMISGGLEFEF